MTSFVLDASVAIAWYVPEVFTDAANVWRSRVDETAFFVPRLHYWELANALRTRIRRNLIDPRSATEIWNTHLQAPFTITDPVPVDVFAIALEYNATAYDAVYIALTLDLDATLITAERSTTAWVMKLGKRAISIAEVPS